LFLRASRETLTGSFEFCKFSNEIFGMP